jgi:ribosomal protein S12 methylthiotransferase
LKKERISVVTLGCSKNVVDSEELMGQLRLNDVELLPTSEGADVVVINTCGFIEAAKRESIEAMLQAVQLKKEGRIKRVVVMGCLSERYAEDLKKEIPGIDAFIGANKVPEVVMELGSSPRTELLGERMLTTPSHFAYLKISEGCDRPCSFCSIPLMRGKHVSRPPDRLVTEARRLAALGVKELILIAQDSTSYGLDTTGKRTLAPLLDRLADVEGLEWIRLMYAFPTGFPVDVLDTIASRRNICKYLDIPVQHVSDSVLTSMKRGIGSSKLRDLLAQIRANVPGIALRTTLIVGYPNEGEKEFRELMDFVKETEFDRLGVFTYSQEEGTTAFPLGDPVPQQVKDERASAVMELQRSISYEKNLKRIGSHVRVLVDQISGGEAIGRTEQDAPEIDNDVVIPDCAGCSVGSFIDATVTDAGEYDLVAMVPANGKEAHPPARAPGKGNHR